MTQTFNRSPATVKTVLDRLDTMLAELQSLRQEVQVMIQTEDKQPRGLADELYGSLGQGSWDELDSNADIEAMRMFSTVYPQNRLPLWHIC